ncbi:hypothetical protein UCRNP2_1245 [Neofusicoccum parvum UCRNP2]|uniref:Uncharacterized protein n=1 Tax=Botryosphaeria parva (strain UCR-NP2) TaxID=1287680 RepID=R1EW07_BOTPV|nr:hypothetical protein UCRNP2_1245 [Neofusicoccum parvum UCRNP2]
MKFAVLLLSLVLSVYAQNGYIGYSLEDTGDPDSAVYETANTKANTSTTYPPPDVFLNASVHVGEIDIEVLNLTAKINLAAQVLSLLDFNAGVDASVDRVSLTIQNVTAKVLLEARLSNLLLMIENILDSLDLNPVLATLGNGLNEIADTALSGLTGDSSSSSSTSNLKAREDLESFRLENNILYSINDYSGNAHTNRKLSQDGTIIDQNLDNNGNVLSEKTIGSYDTVMRYFGRDIATEYEGQQVRERLYEYAPFPGLEIVSAIYVNDAGNVVGTQVLSEVDAGGSSTISADKE